LFSRRKKAQIAKNVSEIIWRTNGGSLLDIRVPQVYKFWDITKK